jgi:hypothetical protein
MNKCVSILVGNNKKEKETIKKDCPFNVKETAVYLRNPLQQQRSLTRTLGQHHKPRYRKTPSFQTPLPIHA